MGEKMEDEEYEKLEKLFKSFQEQAFNIFVEKNRRQYQGSFFTGNDLLYSSDPSVPTAFSELEYAFNKVKRDLLHYEVFFDKERFKRDLLHLANYAIMVAMFTEMLPKKKV